MDVSPEQMVKEQILNGNEHLLGSFRPEKKAFFFYRVKVPFFIFLVLMIFNSAWILLTILMNSGSAAAYINQIGTPLLIAAVLTVNIFVQREMYGKCGYYVTDRRIVVTGGVFRMRYRTYRCGAVGSLELKPPLFSKTFGLDCFHIRLLLTVNKTFSVKFLTKAGTTLLYIEDGYRAYRLINGILPDDAGGKRIKNAASAQGEQQ